MRALFQTKERAHASAHASRAKKNRPHPRPILSPGLEIGPIRGLFFSRRAEIGPIRGLFFPRCAEIGPIRGLFFSWRLEIGPIRGPFFSWRAEIGPIRGPFFSRRAEIGPIRGPFFSWRLEIGPIRGPFFSWRAEIGLIRGPFFGASPQLARRTPDTPLARWQGKAPTKAPRSIPFVREGARSKGRVRETCDAPGCRRGAGIVCRPTMSPWNSPVLVSWVAECLDGFLRQSKPKHPPAPIGGLWRHRMRAPRRLAASHVFASLKPLGQGCAPTPRGGLRCALAARRVQAWEGRP
jgi:hypothetical protein